MVFNPWIQLNREYWVCSPPGFSVHGIFQARILEWVAVSFSRRPSWPRDWTQVSHIVGRCFTVWATRGGMINIIYCAFKKKNQSMVFNPWIQLNHEYWVCCKLLGRENSLRYCKHQSTLWEWLFTQTSLLGSAHSTIGPWQNSLYFLLPGFWKAPLNAWTVTEFKVCIFSIMGNLTCGPHTQDRLYYPCCTCGPR